MSKRDEVERQLHFGSADNKRRDGSAGQHTEATSLGCEPSTVALGAIPSCKRSGE